MRIPLIVGGVVLFLIGAVLALTLSIIGVSSIGAMQTHAGQAVSRWQMAGKAGFLEAVGEVWLWGRCVRATGLDEHEGVQRSYLTDSDRSCGKSALKRAESLAANKANREAKMLAIGWYDIAERLSVPDDFSAQVAYANRILSGDISTNLLPGMEPGTARSGAVLNILIAAWHGDGKAMVRATDLLLEGNTPMEQVGMPREMEAYALLLQAKQKGEDVEERLGLVSLLLDTQVRFEIQDWLKATGQLPT